MNAMNMRHTFLKSSRFILLSLLLGVCSACSLGGARHTQTHYVLSDPQPVTAASKPLWPGTLLVSDVEAPAFYQNPALAFSRENGTRGYYQYARFTDLPGTALTALVVRRLARSGLFEAVSTPGQGVSGQWQLNLRLIDFYHAASSPPGSVLLSFDAELVGRASARLLSHKHFEVTAAADSFDAPGAAAAANRAVGSGLDQLTLWLGSR